MLRKHIFVLLFIFIPLISFAQDTKYMSLLKEVDYYITNNFISPFLNKDIRFINDNYWGFGFKRGIFTNNIIFSNSGVILCNIDENIYSMDDGIIIEIGYNEPGVFILVKHNEIYVYYYCVIPNGVNEGDTIKKGQLLGRISSPYYSIGPSLILKIKYKDYFFDPYFLLYGIIDYYE
ncbi:MAG: M23 family metallopeptidase [Treponema sp.]|jgi:hypothetical protein|nr:M23 family metallopeptidase [Treponema sp.]